MKRGLISLLLCLVFCLNTDAQAFLEKYDSITSDNVRAFMKDWRHWSKELSKTATKTEYNKLAKTNYRDEMWPAHRHRFKLFYKNYYRRCFNHHSRRTKLAMEGDTIIHFEDNIDTKSWNRDTHGDFLLIGNKKRTAYDMGRYYKEDLKKETRAYTLRQMTKAEADTLRLLNKNRKSPRLKRYVVVPQYTRVYNYDTLYTEEKTDSHKPADGYISVDSITIVYNTTEPILYINNAIIDKLVKAIQSSPTKETQFGPLQYGVPRKLKKYFDYYYKSHDNYIFVVPRTYRIEHYTDSDVLYSRRTGGGHGTRYKRIDGKLAPEGEKVTWWMY